MIYIDGGHNEMTNRKKFYDKVRELGLWMYNDGLKDGRRSVKVEGLEGLEDERRKEVVELLKGMSDGWKVSKESGKIRFYLK